MKLSPFLARRLEALQTLATGSPTATLDLPGVRIKGTTNGSQGVTLAGRRFRRGKQAGLRSLGHNAALSLGLRKLLELHGGLVVHLVRVAPNRLDGDNLEASFKRVRDGIAKCIGVDDRSPSVEYVVDDERGAVREYAVRLEVFANRAALPTMTWRKFNEGPLPRETPPASTNTEVSVWAVDWSKERKPTPNMRKPR